MQNLNTLYLHQYDLSSLPTVPSCQLTDYEITKSLRLTSNQREQYNLTRYILRDILKQHGISQNHLYYEASGQPLLHSTFSISLSHSDSIWLVAIMKSEKLGIDIQISLPKNKPALLARFNLATTTSDTSFLKHWMLTESYCKCTQKPLLSTLSTPIETLIKEQKLHSIIRMQPFTFAAVSTSLIQEICLIT